MKIISKTLVIGFVLRTAGLAWAEMPPDGSFCRVTLDGGVSPFSVVVWDITVRGGSVVMSFIKESPCQPGQRERVRIYDGPEADAILKEINALWSLEVPPSATLGRARDRPAPKDSPRYEFWVAYGKVMKRFWVDQQVLVSSPGLLKAFISIRDAVQSRVEPLFMRNLYYPVNKIGYVTMTATEPATAIFDGWEQIRLPVDACEMVEGEHHVVVRGDSGRIREFDLRITAGTTTQVHVVLE